MAGERVKEKTRCTSSLGNSIAFLPEIATRFPWRVRKGRPEDTGIAGLPQKVQHVTGVVVRGLKHMNGDVLQ